MSARIGLRDYGSYIDDLKKGDTVVIADTAHDPRTVSRGEALAGIAAKALVNVPALEHGGLAAMCFVAQATPRDWGGQEVNFVREVANRTQAAIQRQRAEEALRQLAASLEAEVTVRTSDRNRLWQLSTDIMLVAGFDGIITAVNPGWEWTLGWTEHDLLGHSLFDLIHPDDLEHTIAGAKGLSEGESLARFENRYRHKDGSYCSISWMAVPGDGLINAVGRDVTVEREKAERLRTTEEQLRQSQKMEAVGQLTGGVAHDFNNLLTVIRSAIDLLKKQDLPEERRQRYIAAIFDTTERASKLTAQLLAFSRRQALKPEVFDVVASVGTVRDMVRTLTGSRIRIEIGVPNKACLVDADSSQFDTALVNLAVNARDAMDGEGRLTITVRTTSRIPPLRAHPASTGDFVAVSIADAGTGIDPANLDRIFEPFFTTKGVGQGTGLGLSQVFGFVKQSGGEVAVESEVGVGTTFTLYLPRAKGELPEAPRPSEERAGIEGKGTRVLVVEDNPDVGSFTTQTLGELGYAPMMVSDAMQALDLLRTQAAAFDVVFSDVVMPGMNGIELGQEVRRLYPELPVVLSSGYSHVLAEKGDHGFPLLHKPYSIEQLSQALQIARRSVGP